MKIPMPGYGLAKIDASQFENVKYEGEDRFDTPQAGVLTFLRDEDKEKLGHLVGKKVYWAKYADLDATFYDAASQGDVVFIKLDKIVGYDAEDVV